MISPRSALALAGGLLLLCGVGAAPTVAQGEGQYLVNDPGTAAGVRNVMPAGEAGVVSLAEFLHNQADPTWFPAHVNDQVALYDGPTFRPAGTVTATQMQQFTKEETFGVADGQVASTETPQPGLTIIRDKAFGVPHIFATSRALAEYGAGWVSAEDRLFMMDVLRHAGRGNLASLVGSSGYGNDCDTHYGTGYDAADEAIQESQLDPTVVANGHAFANGVNGWIASPGFVQHMPVEYTAFLPPVGLQQQGPFPLPVGENQWKFSDIAAIGALIGSQLGAGGGSEVSNTLALEQMTKVYGAAGARLIFDDLHAANDPESPTTIDQSFPYQSRTGRDPASVALIDGAPQDPQGCTQTRVPPGGLAPLTSRAAAPVLPTGWAVASVMTSATRQAIADRAARSALDIVRAVHFKKHASNAQVVNASHSVSGHPIADFGAQTAYFMPEIWMEMDVHATCCNARGFQLPGTGEFIEIGRGKDYAWSATSAGTDIIDQRADVLCNPHPAPGETPLTTVSDTSTSYWYRGRLTGGVFKCLPMVEKQLQYVVPPSPGTLPDIPPKNSITSDIWAGLETFKVERTQHDDGVGIVRGRTTATLDGQPVKVAITTQRTNFMHELDQSVGFQKWNTDSVVHDAKSFIAAAQSVDTTFNWFYVDAHDTAYYSSGKLPARNPSADPDLVNWGTGAWDWQGLLPYSMHPQAINPPRGYMISWNNRPAPNFGSSDSNWDYGALYRSQMLDRELNKRLAAGGGKVTATDLFNVMQAASVTDFRAQRLLDYLFAIIGPLSPAEQATYGPALAAMRSWHTSPAPDVRQDVNRTGAYAHSDGIMYFDATYPRIVHAVFDPWFNTGQDAGGDPWCDGNFSGPGGVPKTFDNPPSDGHCYGKQDWSGYNVGSSYDGGWQDALDKDFRQVLGQPVRSTRPHVYCGGGRTNSSPATPIEGSRAACRAEVLAALKGAINDVRPPAQVLTDDMIQYRSLGLFALPPEQRANKPTQQQFVEFLADRSSLPTLHGGPAPLVGATGGTPNTARGSLLALVGLLAACLLLGTALGAPGRKRSD